MKQKVKNKFYSVLSMLLIMMVVVVPAASVTANATAGLGLSVGVSKTSQYVGGTVTVTLNGSGGTSPYYYKVLYKTENGYWRTAKSYSTSNKASFTLYSAGKYTIRSYVKDKTGKEIYTSGNSDIVFDVKSKYAALANNSTISAATVNLSSAVTVTSKVSGGNAPYKYLYEYQLYDGTWKTARAYSTVPTCSIKFPSAGYYTVRHTVKDNDGRTCAKTFSVTVKNLTNTALKNNSTISAYSVKLGNTIKVNGIGAGGTQPYMYAFYYQKNGTWVKAADYQKRSYANIKLPSAGTFPVKCAVRDMTGKVVEKAFNVTVYSATGKTLANQSSVNTTGLVEKNTSVIITGNATGGTQPYTYAYYYRFNGGSWITLRGYSSAASATLKLSNIGTYSIMVNAKDYTGKVASKTFTVKSIAANASTVSTKSTITLNYGNQAAITASEGSSAARYEFWYKKTSETQWQILSAYGTKRTVNFRPRELADYYVLVNKITNGVTVSEKYVVRPEISTAIKTELSLINNERMKAGLTPLTLDYSLTYCAGIRSEETIIVNDHVRPYTNKDWETVLIENGITNSQYHAENLGFKPSAKSVMISFMASPKHRGNILDDTFNRVGLGLYQNHWVQIFSS